MMHTTRNWSNDTAESQKEKISFSMLIFSKLVKYHGTKLTCTSQYCVCELGEVF